MLNNPGATVAKIDKLRKRYEREGFEVVIPNPIVPCDFEPPKQRKPIVFLCRVCGCKIESESCKTCGTNYFPF